MGYGATDEPEAEEMQGMTDDEADIKSRKKKGKGGMKPGQALSFSGLEKRSHTGGDMLDMQVVRCAPVFRLVIGCTGQGEQGYMSIIHSSRLFESVSWSRL